MKTILFSIFWIGTILTTIAQTKKPTTKKPTTTTINKTEIQLDSNDCSNWVKVNEDKVMGTTSSSIKQPLIIFTPNKSGGASAFNIQIMKGDSKGIILLIKAYVNNETVCIKENSKVNILFTDGSRIELTSNGDFNCKGDVVIYLGDIWGKDDILKDLQSKTIDILRVWTNDSYIEQTFQKKESNNLKYTIKCLNQ
jgi:hypothetical protein